MELKDYLHFYLGCDGYTQKRLVRLTGVNYNSELKWLWEAIESDMKGAASAAKDIYSPGFSPILRPLSDMTEEEKGFRWKTFCNIKEINQQVVAEEFRWLLSKHFDLFGLIENGLAIYKTKL